MYYFTEVLNWESSLPTEMLPSVVERIWGKKKKSVFSLKINVMNQTLALQLCCSDQNPKPKHIGSDIE